MLAGTDYAILAAGALLLVSILAGVASSRIGAPLLLVFLVLGMLLGEDGPGGILFDDFPGAYLIGSLSLAIILFDGGFRTPIGAIRMAWKPATLLATVGVLVTATITGVIAAAVMGGPLLSALLVGAIVASTDAAAVFLLLHQHGMELRRRVSTTLEVESGANDPMAVFLTVTLIGLLTSTGMDGDPAFAIVRSLVLQLGLGALAGLAGGYAIAWAVNRLEVAPGLYPVFVIAAALFVFGGTQTLGGSGFLAVYLAGIVAGNRRMRATRLVRRFHDGIAWISQIVMFLILGLLVTPKAMLPDLLPATVVALALIFVARPAAVWLCLAPFNFPREERLFIAWVGLRGAVPIFLAIFPVVGGVPDGYRYFNIAFLVVLASLVLQGWTIPWVARWLGVEVPRRPEPVGKLDIDLPSQLDRDVVGYLVDPTSAASGKPVSRLHLPRRTRVLAVLRDNAVVRHETLESLQAGDYVLVIAPPEQSFVIDRQFAPRRARRDVVLGDFVFPADLPAARLLTEYGLPVEPADGESLGDYLAARLGPGASVGDALRIGESELVVHEVDDDRISQVALRIESRPPVTMRSLADRAVARLRRLRRRVLGR